MILVATVVICLVVNTMETLILLLQNYVLLLVRQALCKVVFLRNK